MLNVTIEMIPKVCPDCNTNFWLFPKSQEELNHSEHLTCVCKENHEEPKLNTGENPTTKEIPLEQTVP
jgi:hypothetical protein